MIGKAARLVEQVRWKWTVVPESTVTYARFMHSAGTAKAEPADRKELLSPEAHALPGS